MGETEMVLLAEGPARPCTVVEMGPQGAPERGLCLGSGGGGEARQESEGLPADAEGALRAKAGWPQGATEGFAQRQGHISSDRESKMGETLSS